MACHVFVTWRHSSSCSEHSGSGERVDSFHPQKGYSSCRYGIVRYHLKCLQRSNTGSNKDYIRVSSSQSFNLDGRRGTTAGVVTISFIFPCLLAPFTVACRTVFAMLEDLEMWPYHLNFRFFIVIKRWSCTPIASWILLRTSSFVTW